MSKKIKLSTDTAGIFISLNTMPFGKEQKFIDYLKSGYQEHKKRILSFIREAKEKKGYSEFYEPIGYYLWGTYDLALVSLIDDFTLSSRDYCANSNLFDRKNLSKEDLVEFSQFDYEVISGAHTIVSDLGTQTEKSNLQNVWGKISRGQSPVFDFIGICTIKINNGLIIGTGYKTIDLVKVYINSLLTERLADGKGEFVILDTFSWYEIAVMVFSNDLDLIGKVIVEFREKTTEELEVFASETGSINSGAASKIFKRIKSNSLLLNQLSSTSGVGLFANTYTTLGFSTKFLEDKEYLGELGFDFTKKIRLTPKFTIKPGLFGSTLKQVASFSNRNDLNYDGLNFIYGEGDAFINFNGASDNTNFFTFEEYLDFFCRNGNLDFEGIRANISRIKTMVHYENIDISASNLSSENGSSNYLRDFTFDSQTIDNVRETLYGLRLSKAVRERITRLYNIYNSNILDESMYVYFIDFQPILVYLRSVILNYKSSFDREIVPLQEVHNVLTLIAEIFEKCYLNRFHQSKALSEVPSVNLDFNGGIHQIVSATDTIYKCIFGAINIFHKDPDTARAKLQKLEDIHPLAYLSGHPGIEANKLSLRLNYFHVFEPILLLSIISKEASNFVPLNLLPVNHRNDSNFSSISMTTKRHSNKAHREEIIQEVFDGFNLSIGVRYAKIFIESDGKLIDYLFADAINFHCSYFLDCELYRFWFWHIAAQTPTIYNSNGQPNEKSFIRLLIRYSMIMKYSGYNENSDALTCPIACMQNLWYRHYDNISDFVNEVFKLKSVIKYFKNSISETISYIIVNLSEGNADTIFKGRISKRNSDRVETLFKMQGNNTLFNNIDNKLQIKKWLKYSYSLESGTDSLVTEYKIFESQDLPLDQTSFVQSSLPLLIVFNRYLRNVFSSFPENIYDLSMLDRDFKPSNPENHIFIDKKLSNVILGDEIGGLFYLGLEIRRNSFKQKIDFFKFIIDFSLKYKSVYFEK